MEVTKSSIWQFLVFHFFLLTYYLTFPYKDRWLSTGFLLVIVFVLAWLEYSRTHSFISPILIWYVFWLGVISVGRMDLNLYPFYQVWSEDLLKLITLNTAVFYWAYWIAEVVRSRTKEQKSINIDENSFMLILIGVMAVACIAFTLNVLDTGVIPQLTGDANAYREAFVQNRFFKIVNICRFSFALVPYAIRITNDKLKKNILIAFSALLLFMEMLTGWRTYTIQSTFLILTGFFMTGESKSLKIRRRNLKVIICSVIIVLIFIGYIAVTRDKVTGALKDKLSYVLYTLYMYIAPNFLNLQTAIETIEPINRPVYSTTALWTFIINSDVGIGKYGEIDQAIGTFNVSTYLLQPWGDFGTFGTVLWSALIGGVSGVSFHINRKQLSLFSIVVLGIMNITIFLLHNNLFLRTKSIILWVIFTYLIQVLCKKRSSIESGKILVEK